MEPLSVRTYVMGAALAGNAANAAQIHAKALLTSLAVGLIDGAGFRYGRRGRGGLLGRGLGLGREAFVATGGHCVELAGVDGGLLGAGGGQGTEVVGCLLYTSRCV